MVSTMPTFVFFKGGKKADFVPGSDVAKVEKAIEKFLPKEQSTDNTNHFITVQTKVSVTIFKWHIFMNLGEFLNVNQFFFRLSTMNLCQMLQINWSYFTFHRNRANRAKHFSLPLTN